MSDELAQQDALALFRFLRRRGFIKGEPGPMPELLRDASPLTGVDMVVAETDGVVTWRVLLQYRSTPILTALVRFNPGIRWYRDKYSVKLLILRTLMHRGHQLSPGRKAYSSV